MSYKKILSIILVIKLVMALPAFAQQSGESDVTKYTVKEYLEANLPPQEGRKIVLDEITGLLTITDTPANQALALELIKEWDIGPKQISIEAKFIEITFTDLDEMGVEWQFLRTDSPVVANYTGSAAAGTDTLLAGMMGAAANATNFAIPTSTAGLGLWVGKALISGNTLRAYLKALEQSGKVNLLNAPRITTLSGQMANIQVVRSFPYAVSAERTEIETGTTALGGGSTETNYTSVETYEIEEEITGISLEVTPTVLEGSDIITLEIHPEVTKLSQQVAITTETDDIDFPDNLGWPIIDTRTTQTSVMVRSGQTILIGGLIQDQDQRTVERKIPFLGDIPLIGNLFKYKYQNREKKNLVVFLTAKLINAQGEDVR